MTADNTSNPLRTALTSRNAMLLVALVVIGLVFHALTLSRGAQNPFLSARSISTVFTQASVIGVLACGMTLIIILTHVDLSVGSAMAFLGALAAWMMGPPAAFLQDATNGGVPTGLGWSGGMTIPAIVAIGIVLWGLMGWLQVKTRMPAFIITLGGMMGYRGLALLIAKRERPIPTGSLVDQIGTAHLPLYLGWTILAIVMAFAVYSIIMAWRHHTPTWYLAWVPCGLLAATVLFLQIPHSGVLESSRGIACLTGLWALAALAINHVSQNTVFGRHLYAAGGNSEAAMLCGIRVQRVNIIAFIIMGVLTALAALMYLGQQGTAESAAGQLGELDAIAACVIGGGFIKRGARKYLRHRPWYIDHAEPDQRPVPM